MGKPVLREPTVDEKYLVIMYRDVAHHADAEIYWTSDYEDAVDVGSSPEYEAYNIIEPKRLVFVD